jgi:hypothetical protein
MTNVSRLAKRSIWRMSGVLSCSTEPMRVLMRPSSVSAPVATTTPAPWPAATKVPENAAENRSPSGASASTGSVAFSTATDSPGEDRLVDAQVARPHQPQVGRHAVAGLEHHVVAGHDVVCRHGDAPAVADERGLRVDHLADGRERLFGAAFLNEADDRVDDDHRQDHQGIDLVADEGGEHGRPQQDPDEQAVELRQQARQGAARRRLGKPVGAVGGAAALGFLLAQALRPRFEVRQHLVGRARVPRLVGLWRDFDGGMGDPSCVIAGPDPAIFQPRGRSGALP